MPPLRFWFRVPFGIVSPDVNSFQLLERHGTPLLYLPLDPLAAERGLELYPAQSRKARLLKAGVRFMFKVRLRMGYMTAQSPIPHCEALNQLFCELSGCAHPPVAILAGNPKSQGRRFICLIMDGQAEPKAVVKVGVNPSSRNLIRREYGILSSIPGSVPGVARVRRLLETDQLSALVLDYASGIAPRSVAPERLFGFLRGWICNESPQPLFDFPQMRELRERFGDPLLERLQEPLRDCLATPVISNGDFAPWNIREDSFGQWTVLDWERGELRAIPGWNWFHFSLQQQVLVRKADPAQLVAAVEAFLNEPHFRSYCALCGIAGLERELLLLYLLYVMKVFKPAEGLDIYEMAFATLQKRWLPPSPVAGEIPPDISIVTPSYKQPEWLKLCAASTANQLGVRFEHIIQDAGTPGVEELVPKASARLRLFQEKDSGMYDAINRGFLKARGEIVAWLNCDEQYLPGTLRTVVDFFREHPEVDVLFGDALLIDDAGRVVSYRRSLLPHYLHTRLAHLGVLSCSMFLRRSLVQRGFLLDTRWKTIADAVFVVSLLKAKCRMAVLNQPLAAFAITKVNLGQTSFLLAEMEYWRGELPALVRALTPLVILHHRIRKLLGGAYRKWRIHTTLFRPDTQISSQEVQADAVSFAWPGSSESLSKRSSYHAGFESQKGPLNLSSMQRGVFAIAGLVLVTGIFVLDLQIDTLVVSPFFCALTLLALAFVLQPLELGLASALMGAVVFCSLVYNQQFRLGNPEMEWLRVLLRLGSFASACTLAILFSRYRLHSARMTGQTFEVLRRIPAPVIVSDAYGKIRFANTAAVHLFGEGSQDLVGVSYLRLLLNQSDEGSAGRLYREAFEGSAAGDRTIQLFPQKGGHLRAHTASIGERENRLLVTLIAS